MPDDARVRCATLAKGRLAADAHGRCIGVVVEGLVDVYSVAADGSEVKVSTLGTGDAFGICNLYTRASMPTVLRCRTRCRVALVPKDRFVAMMRADGRLAERYARLCNEKIAFLIRRIEELTAATSTRKLERYLREHADGRGLVTTPGTREDLARYLGISRSALFREIARLKKEGALYSVGRNLYVSAPRTARSACAPCEKPRPHRALRPARPSCEAASPLDTP